MNYIIGGLLGISISNFYWRLKFKKIGQEISQEISKLICKQIQEKTRYQKIIEAYAKTGIKPKKPRGGISCK